jgi:thioredoxin reductase
VIIATGRSLRRSEVKGEREFEGRGVSFWPQSDAEKYRGMKIAVICGPDAEAGLVSHICRFASEVYLIGEVKGKITGTVRELGKGGLNEIVGKRMVRGIVVGNETVDVDAVFVNLGFRPNSDLVSGKARLNDLGEIVIDKENNTSIRGVFAAGDVTDINEKQILVAVGEGVKAANSAISYIRSHPESGYEAV